MAKWQNIEFDWTLADVRRVLSLAINSDTLHGCRRHAQAAAFILDGVFQQHHLDNPLIAVTFDKDGHVATVQPVTPTLGANRSIHDRGSSLYSDEHDMYMERKEDMVRKTIDPRARTGPLWDDDLPVHYYGKRYSEIAQRGAIVKPIWFQMAA